mmetsp:Transcript_15035/g.29557  ORF Transcript_15035/g.29557 Transcript_15035/m.29557 type:complete len:227 (-) Transcript_15035:115-795(-)|eukprot:CAMPEP_0175149982 /NCGR_PEP_ID=MMETSP0087-20121206/17584_1 /TAXON_ID=136419 /ORGANISM="Unknown Unknown, Strain D1" /LENGTH=226 /DNA_ID=CAMNT_0016435811 /DNA_START=23 /DNA_END=703 /DNA_ORIENTATION=-
MGAAFGCCSKERDKDKYVDGENCPLEATPQFGVDVSRVVCEADSKHKSRIPVVLTVLLNYLRCKNALQLEGIFRVSANDDECISLQNQLNRTVSSPSSAQQILELCNDVHCASTLIKRWFRELPVPVLSAIMGDIQTSLGQVDVGKLIFQLPEPQQSLVLWFLDMCIEVNSYEAQNLMSIQNISLVMSPNLAPLNQNDPVEALTLSGKVQSFIQYAIQWRAAQAKH